MRGSGNSDGILYGNHPRQLHVNTNEEKEFDLSTASVWAEENAQEMLDFCLQNPKQLLSAARKDLLADGIQHFGLQLAPVSGKAKKGELALTLIYKQAIAASPAPGQKSQTKSRHQDWFELNASEIAYTPEYRELMRDLVNHLNERYTRNPQFNALVYRQILIDAAEKEESELLKS